MRNYLILSIAVSMFLSVVQAQDGRKDTAPGKSSEAAEEGGKKAPSLLKNGSFEGEISVLGAGLGFWTASVASSASTKYEFDSKFACDGDQSLMLSNLNPKLQAPLSFSQPLGGKDLSKWQGRELKLAACIRTEDAEFADIRVEAIDAKNKTIDWLSLTGGGVHGTRDWSRSNISLIVGENIATLRIYCVLKGTGSAWFDDVRLTVVPLEKTKHLEGVLGDAREAICRYVRAKSGSEESSARSALEPLRSSATLETIRALFAKGFSYPEPNSAASVDEDLRTGGRTVYQVCLPAGYDISKRWPMLLDLSKPGTGQPWADGEGKRFLVVRPKNLGMDHAGAASMNSPAIGKSLPDVLAVLRDARAKYAVDPDKVCVLGEAERADLAAAAALGNRGEFSSLVLIRPAKMPAGDALANASGLPVFLALEGGDRSPLAPTFESWKSKGATLLVRDLDPARVAAVALGADVFRWFEGRTRSEGLQGFDETLATSGDLGSFTARVLSAAPGATGKIHAKFGNKRKIELDTEGIRKIRLLVPLDQVGLPGDIEVVINGTTKYQGRPSFDFDVFLENLRQYADSKRLWGAQIDLEAD